MTIVMGLIMLYLAMLVVVIMHELGHAPTKGIKVMGWFPFPEAAAMAARFRFGGLIMNYILLFVIFYYQPENTFLQLVGFVSWFHFVLYSICGSFNFEPSEKFVRRNPSMLKWYVFDDVPNNLAIIFVPLGIMTYIWFSNYYIPIIMGLFG